MSNRVWEVDEEEERVEEAEAGFDFSSAPLINDYEPGKELGRGFYAIANVVTEKKTGEQYVVKVIDKSMAPQFSSGSLKSELDTLSKLDHPNIVKGKQYYETETHLFVVLEYAKGGEFSSVLSQNPEAPYSELDAHRLAKQLSEALAHIHKQNIIHGDLAPENVFFSENKDSADVKLGGFSSAFASTKSGNNVQLVGNAEFQAPEILMNQGFNEKSDIWSLGCILYYLIEGSSPFQDSNTMRMNMKIRQGKLEFGDNWASVSQSLKDLISSLVKVNAEERLTADDILSNEWMMGIPPTTPLPNARKTMGQN